MPIFRVYLRRAASHDASWDYAETVVTASAADAIAHAHAQWAHSVGPGIPALPHCQSQAVLVHASSAPPAHASPAQQALLHALTRKVNHCLRPQLQRPFQWVNAPAGLPTPLTDGQGWRRASLAALDSLLSVSAHGQLTLSSERFSALYQHLLLSTAFVWSEQDQNILRRQAADSADAAQAVLDASPIVRAAALWPKEDALQAVFDQLCRQFGSPEALPESWAPLRQALAAYRAQAGESYALRRWRGMAQARLDAARAHVQRPSADNGGAALSDGGWGIGYQLDDPEAPCAALAHGAPAVSLSASLSDFVDGVATVTLPEQMPFCLHSADILSFSAGELTGVDLSRYAPPGARIELTLCWAGLCALSPQPHALDADNRRGWWARDILREVLELSWEPVSSYKLVNPDFDLNYLFGPGMVFSRLSQWVISRPPTLTLRCQGVNAERLRAELAPGMAVSAQAFKLFSLGQIQGDYQLTQWREDDDCLTLTFAPRNEDCPSTAYVLGGAPAFPPLGV